MELTICKQIDEQLDEIEAKLPPLAANVLSVNRAIAARTQRDLSRLGTMLADSAGAIASAAAVGIKTVGGTASWATERATSAAATGARQTIGQAKAQTKLTVDTASEELDELAEDIDPAVASVPAAGDLQTLTKAELYDRAQDRDIDGRSAMSKAELVAALSG